MRIILPTILFIFVFPLVLAQDAALTINGVDPSSGITIKPGDTLDLTVNLAQGVALETVTAETENKLLQELLNEYLQEIEPLSENDRRSRSKSITLPPVLPSGKHDIVVTSFYTKNGESHQSGTIPATVEGGAFGSVLNLLTGSVSEETAAELVDYFLDRKLPKIDRSLSDEELRFGGYDPNSVSVRNIGSTSPETVGDGSIGASGEHFGETLISFHVFEITDDITGEVGYQTKIILGVTNKKSLNNVEIVFDIPKSVAADVSEILFSDRHEVIEADPIIKWNFDHIPASDTKEYSGTVNKQVENNEGFGASAAGNEPGFNTRFTLWLVKGGWVIALIVIFVLIIGGIIVLVKSRKSKG